MSEFTFNFRQFIFAREYRGYSQSDLAKSIEGLSQPNLSKFEKGLGTISEELLYKIISSLNFPEVFFTKKINNYVENAHYRKRTTLSKKEKNEIEYTVRLAGYIIDEMSASIEWPEFSLNPLNVEEGYSPETIAKYARKTLKIKPNEPVKDINKLIESHGVVIIEIDNIEKFDGVSLLTDNGIPVIIINKSFSNDRKRFTLAHELGHLLMHICGDFPISDYRDEKEREKEANIFASEFLMPKDSIKNSLYGLKLSDLIPLKSYWLTSMQSLIRRAYDLNCIDKNKYVYLNMEFSRRGNKKNEGYDVFIDSPVLFNKAYKLFKEDLSYSKDEMAEGFGLPIDVMDRYFTNDRSARLRIVV